MIERVVDGFDVFFPEIFRHRIGGYTGDCLGASQQLAEIAFYLGLLCVST